MDLDNNNRQPSIPPRALSANDPTTLHQTQHITGSCCCGSECTQHGLTLKSLEKDVRDAARVGQALLIRHETYVTEAETERARLSNEVARLERSTQDLQIRNTQLVTENSSLLDQADDVNNAVHEAEIKVQSLTATLHSTQRELDRITRLAARTETLEAQLLDCEKEQARLQATLARSNEEERAALQKWRNSHRRILELEEQIEDIENEARQERARHEEVEERFERRRAVEKELEASAAAADQGQEKRGSEVVSSFVKEILQDNANMQLAMVELQDLLAYYKEAELMQATLRPDEFEDPERRRHPNLSDELGGDQEQSQRQVHVHHHYHAPTSAASAPPRQSRSRSQQAQKPKKRRPVLVSGRSTPVNLSQSPQRAAQRHKPNVSTSSSVGSFDNRVSKQKRWSAQSMQSQSSFNISSGPSSPRSTSYCPSTIFEHDLVDKTTEYSRPTSPESNAVWSPATGPVHRKLASNDSSFQPMSLPSMLAIDEMIQPPSDDAIPTISEQALELPIKEDRSNHKSSSPIRRAIHRSNATTAPSLSPTRGNSPRRPLQKSSSPTRAAMNQANPPSSSPTRDQSPRRPLCRTDSHASLFSISGMDIHSTLPSPVHAPVHSHPLRSRQQSSAVLTEATASAIKASQLNGSNGLNRSLQGRLRPNGVEQRNDHYTPLTDTFGKRIGGWLTSRWAPAPPNACSNTSTAPSREGRSLRPKKATESDSTPEADERGHDVAGDQSQTTPVDIQTNLPPMDAEKEKLSLSKSPRKLAYRTPGINQDGGLPPLPLPGGFRSIGRVPITRMVDEEALKECLEQTADERSAVQATG